MNSNTISKNIHRIVNGVSVDVEITTESPDGESAMGVANRIESAVSEVIEGEDDE